LHCRHASIRRSCGSRSISPYSDATGGLPAFSFSEKAMEFGVQFFPSVGPDTKSGAQYFDECLKLCDLCDPYGYTHVRTVEHYFLPYGGYTPNPIVFLTAMSQRTKKARVVTGAVLPVFNHPLKIAGEAGMLDAISGGRLDLGMARAFLPHEFAQFGISFDESVARFDEGTEQVRRLLEDENVTMEGRFHSFKNVTSLPRPTQKPRPPIWTACTTTPESFAKAGRKGDYIMAIPLVKTRLKELLAMYRDAWRAAGHPGNGKVMLAFHMFCNPDAKKAADVAREPLNRYLRAIVDATKAWKNLASKDYPGYDKMVDVMEKENFDTQVAGGGAWVGTPAQLIDQIEGYREDVGGFEIASMQVNFGHVPGNEAERSMRLFGEKVIPHFAARRASAAE
jgi:alkanesulfonate monooxygenase SsuD/methylene tetrahydromethanopterin reductase-like flavin-dependent oxidoreductase (luciferase family)